MANFLLNNVFRISVSTLNFVSPSIVADILLHPFDFATVLLQIGFNPEGNKYETATLVSVIVQYALFTFYIPYLLTSMQGLQFMGMPHPSIFYYVNYIYNKEGFRGCYRGLMPKICERLIMVSVNERVRRSVNKERMKTSSNGVQNESEEDNFLQNLINGICSQFFAVLASHPFHVIMVSSFAEFTYNKKSSILELSHSIYKGDGYFGFFTGLASYILLLFLVGHIIWLYLSNFSLISFYKLWCSLEEMYFPGPGKQKTNAIQLYYPNINESANTARLLGELLSLIFSLTYTTIINKQMRPQQSVADSPAVPSSQKTADHLVNYVTDISRFTAFKPKSTVGGEMQDMIVEDDVGPNTTTPPNWFSRYYMLLFSFLGNLTQNTSPERTQLRGSHTRRRSFSFLSYIPLTSKLFYYIMIRDFLSKKISNPFFLVCHCAIVLDAGWDKFPLLTYLEPVGVCNFIKVHLAPSEKKRRKKIFS